MMWSTMELESGMKVGIRTFDGAYEGIIHVIDEENGKFSLKKIVNSDTGKKRHGLLCFFEHEILHLEILDDGKKKNEKLVDESILEKSQNKDPPQSCSRDPSEKEGEICDQGASRKSKENSPQKAAPTQTIPDKESPDVVIIDELDRNFYKAINYIQEEKEVGLAMEGVNIGRYGRLCWLQIATTDYIFLFDLLDLAEEFMQNGLKTILENSSINKIIHDCRRISDALFHKFETKLVNVYDTQVADVLVYKLLNGGDMPRYVRNLTSCLTDHLKLNSSDVFFSHVRMLYSPMDEGCWKRRPLPSQLVDAAVKNVVSLKRLKTALIEKLNAEQRAGVELYLAANRDAKSEEIATASHHLLPQCFQKMLSHSLKKKASNGLLIQNNEVYFDCYGFRTNNIHIGNPNLLFTRDSWHQFDRVKSRYTDVPVPPFKLQQIPNNDEDVVPKPREKSSSTPPKSPAKSDKSSTPIKNIKKDEITDDDERDDNIWEKIRGKNQDKEETKKPNIIPAGFHEHLVRKKNLKLSNENELPNFRNDKKAGVGRGLFNPVLLDKLNAMKT